MVIFVLMAMITPWDSNSISQANANCAFGDGCQADSHTATGDSNNPKSWENTRTVDTGDKCYPHKQICG
jgi:hypothetical protein